MTAARAKQTPVLSEEDKRYIYQVLARNFMFDESFPLANLGWCFVSEGIASQDFGFLNLRAMLQQLGDYIEVSEHEVGGVAQFTFVLRENDAYLDDPVRIDDASWPTVTGSLDAGQGDQGETPAEPSDLESAAAVVLEELADEACSFDAAEVPEDAILPEGFEDELDPFAFDVDVDAEDGLLFDPDEELDEAMLAELVAAGQAETGESTKKKRRRRGRRGGRNRRSQADAAAAQGDGAGQSGAHGQAGAQGQSGAQGQAGAARPVNATGQKNAAGAAPGTAKGGQGAEGAAARSLKRRMERVPPAKVIERFAYLGSWEDLLRELAALALDEPWDFNDPEEDGDRKYGILLNYVRYTFYRLTLEDKVGYSADETFCAFNTGLVDMHYQDIYACFEPNAKANSRVPWQFAAFCTAGTGRYGKRLVSELSPLPQPASYLERKEDLLFDLERPVVCDIEHIVVDNIHRLPLRFLRDELSSSKECKSILDRIERTRDRAKIEARYEELRTAVSCDSRLFSRLSNSVNAAIDLARRQVRWNYKAAVPAYYPRGNNMNLLLPLNLTAEPTPDVALVVELQKSGNYQGQTIITMAQAYRDARLVCRPYIDWLSPESIIDTPDAYDDMDDAGAEGGSYEGAEDAAETMEVEG